MRTQKRRGMAAAVLLVWAAFFPTGSAAQPAPSKPTLPDEASLSEVEIRLAYETHGGCLGRCIRYQIIVRGDGSLQYEDLGGEPRDATQTRVIPVDQVVSLIDDFVRARFFDAAPSYDSEPVALRHGDLLRFGSRGSIDGPEWRLTLRIGDQVKTVRLYRGFPAELGHLRDAVEALGGPKAWAQ